MKPIITGFLDQDGQLSLEDQIEQANRHDLDALCLKSYKGEKLIELSEPSQKQLLQTLKQNRLRIAIIDPQIRTYDLYDDRAHREALDEFKYMAMMADRLRATHLYHRLPVINDVIKEFADINERLTPFLDIAHKHGKKLVLVPSDGQKTNVYAYILKKFKNNQLSIVFDPVYLMLNDESTTTAYRLLKGHIGAVRAIDADLLGNPCLMGYGKTDILAIFKKLLRDKYQGMFLVDNHFYNQVFNPVIVKQSFFKRVFSSDKKKREGTMQDLARKIFPKEENRTVTYDDILDNQIKVLNVIFR